MRILGIDAKLFAVSDIQKPLRKHIASNFKPQVIHAEVAVEAGLESGVTDLYIAGPPCQDFSLAGGRAGESGKRGGLFEVCVDRIIRLQARYFILDNVVGLLSIDAGGFLGRMIDKLRRVGNCVVS